MAVLAVADCGWLLANYREEQKERQGKLELLEHLRRDTFKSMEEEIKTTLEPPSGWERLRH